MSLDGVPLGLKRREVGLAPLGERVPRGRQPLPQHRLDGPVGVRGGLPLLEQLGHPLAALLPVRGLGRDALRLVDDPLLDPAGLAPGLLAGGLDFLPALVDDAGQRLEAQVEGRRGRRSRSRPPRRQAAAARWPGPGRGRPRSSSCAAPAARPRSRGRRTCAGRTRVPLPGFPPPTSRSPARHRRCARRPSRRRLPDPRDRWRWSRRTSWFSSRPGRARAKCSSALLVGHVLLMLTLSMTTLSFGTPPPAPAYVQEVPALATFWRISSPEVIVPNGV